MSQTKNQINLPSLRTETHSKWLQEASKTTCHRLFVTTSGYETRCIHWFQKTETHFSSNSHVQYLVIGFHEFRTAISRPENDKYYSDKKLTIEIADAESGRSFYELVTKRIEGLLRVVQNDPIEIHFDYSCMPRLWYCNLPELCLKTLRPIDRAFLWYTPGQYPEAEYPTAGVEDFKVFSGKPSLNARFRTHIFGLGFDRVRSQAIWSVLDPQNLVCFYADLDVVSANVDRVKADNRDVMAAANHTFSVPVRDFIYAYGLIASIVSEFRNIGDVVIVPDGPKPLILASSLIPLRLEVPGVLCFHVTRRKGQNYKPVDVKPIGEPFGLSFVGRRETAVVVS